jgi:hypothetical protein
MKTPPFTIDCDGELDAQRDRVPKAALEQVRVEKTRASQPLPPIIGEILIPAHTTGLQLASILSRKPYQIIVDLVGIGVFANLNEELDFDTIAKVTRLYGYTAKNAA